MDRMKKNKRDRPYFFLFIFFILSILFESSLA